MYEWRKLSPAERKEILELRINRRRPWHSPPHFFATGTYILSAACYEHQPYIGHSAERMDSFSDLLLDEVEANAALLHAWCVLPNHYHVVVGVDDLRPLLSALGKLHGRTSYQWNLEETSPGRKVWWSLADRRMRSEAHLWALINYVHNNPIKHGYVQRWQDWPWGSSIEFLKQMGSNEAKRIWHQYPVDQYDEGWDDE